MKLFDSIKDWLFPPRCPFCGAIRSRISICDDCQTRLPWLEGRQSETVVEFADGCYSPLLYDERVKRAVAKYKFDRVTDYHKIFSLLMHQCAGDHIAPPCDLVSWVPLHPKRLAERGFHQTKLLGKELGRLEQLPTQETLRKIRSTDAQSSIDSDAARRANVLGAYELCQSAEVAGKRLLLVDDVVTTGATLSECARVLKTAGAAEVYIITLAKARKNQ